MNADSEDTCAVRVSESRFRLNTNTQCKGDKHFQDAGGRTALHFAAYDGHVEAAQTWPDLVEREC